MNKSTVLLLGFLAVLGAIVLFVLPKDEEQIASYDRSPVTFTVDSASVVKLSIERAGKRIVIENVGGKWTITSHGNLAADPARVTEVVGGFARFRSGSLVSTNPAKQSVFQVDSSGSLVTLTERSGAERSIVVGKMGPSFSEVYFRMPGSSSVYLGTGITTWSLEREVKDWRDRSVFAAPAEAITAVTVSSGGKTREFRRDSTGWKAGRDPVPTETINPVITALSDLRAEDFIDSEVQLSGAPSTVRVEGGVTATLRFYRVAGDTARYAVETSGSPQRYIVGKFAATQLFKPVGDPRASGLATILKGAPSSVRPATAEAQEPVSEPAQAAGEAERPVSEPPATRTKTEPAPGTSAAGREAPKDAPKEATKTAKDASKAPKEEPPPVTKEAAAPPAKAPASGGAVNPFKQKSSAERTAQPPATTPPPTGQPDARRAPEQQQKAPAQTPAQGAQQPAKTPAQPPAKPPAGAQGGDDEGELTVHVVQKGESMTTIAQKYGVSVEQILKWNLLKSISVKPGQELYIFLRK